MTDLPHRRKALPLAQSILWAPGGAPPGDMGPYTIFMHQRALNALHEHLKSSPDKGVLGFLIGHLYEDPPSQQKFAVIELVMRLTVAIYGDKTTVVVSRVWDKMQEELTRSAAQLLGWYHSHPPGGVELAQGDLETHATYFGEVWQSALVIGTGPEGTLGALYRPSGDGSDAGIPLPFYELLDPRSVTPDGKKRSSVRWGNYKPHRPPAGVAVGRSGPVPAVPDTPPALLSFKPSPQSAPEKPVAAAPPPPPPPLPPPPRPPSPPPPSPPPTVPRPPVAQRPISADMVPLADTTAMIRSGKVAAVPDPTLTPAPPRRRPSGRQPRFVLGDRPKRRKRVGLVLFLLLLLGGGGAAAWYFLLGPGAAAAPESAAATAPAQAPATAPDTLVAAPPARVDSAPALAQPDLIASGPPPAPPAFVPGPIDRLSDTLIVAIRSYEERSRLYQGGLADCTILARGLVAVEESWTRYEAEKKQLTQQLDATRSQRDLQLFSSVDSVSANYDRSGCRRP